jgi:hypothetical protein
MDTNQHNQDDEEVTIVQIVHCRILPFDFS